MPGSSSQFSSQRHFVDVMPILARLRSQPREGPQTDALRFDADQVGEFVDQGEWIRSQSGRAIEKMLSCIVGRISQEWLGIDDEPRFPLCGKYVAGV